MGRTNVASHAAHRHFDTTQMFHLFSFADWLLFSCLLHLKFNVTSLILLSLQSTVRIARSLIADWLILLSLESALLTARSLSADWRILSAVAIQRADARIVDFQLLLTFIPVSSQG